MNAEDVEDGQHPHDVRQAGQDRAQTVRQARTGAPAFFERRGEHAHGQVDDPAADDPGGQRRQHLHAKMGALGAQKSPDCFVFIIVITPIEK